MNDAISIPVFYFSGTGNSKMLAQELAALLPGGQAVNIVGYDVRKPVEADRVGFVFPVYFWGLPNLVHCFLSAVQLRPGAYTFALANMAASAGVALPLAAQHLRDRGAPLRAGWTVKMPEGFILLMGPGTQEAQQTQYAAARQRLPAMAAMIREKTPTKLHSLNPAAALYHQLNRERFGGKDRAFSVTEDCTHCGKCAQICPVENISLEADGPHWQHHCERCMACIQSCPVRAISGGTRADQRPRYLNPNV